MKIALFKSVGKYPYESVWIDRDGTERIVDGYVLCSKWIDVAFPMLEPHEIVNNELAALDVKADEVRAELGLKLAAIDARKQELMAITDQRDAVQS